MILDTQMKILRPADPFLAACAAITVREYETVNGVPGRGGSLDGPGPVIAGGMMFVNSGYTVDGGIAGQCHPRLLGRRSVIRISHVGTLPRPEQLDALCTRNELPRDTDAFMSTVPGMIVDVVRKQAELGITIVNDGEFGKKGGFSYYAQSRLSGIESRSPELTPGARDITARDAIDFPGYYRARRPRINRPMFCVGPLKYAGRTDLQFDTDCGLGSRVGHPEIAWAKLEALIEGARFATKALWRH
jgi:methionine synthase II (cobalamin-independent)